jgi:hypothetical protein
MADVEQQWAGAEFCTSSGPFHAYRVTLSDHPSMSTVDVEVGGLEDVGPFMQAFLQVRSSSNENFQDRFTIAVIELNAPVLRFRIRRLDHEHGWRQDLQVYILLAVGD